MKTSNKILLGLLIAVFAIPILLAFSLKRKIKKGEYTIVKQKNSGSSENVRSGTFTTFKVVNVIAPGPDYLTCHLKQSEQMNYKYRQQDSNDSIMVFTSNDTLFVKYKAKETTHQDDKRDRNTLIININLHAFNNLVVDGAVVVLDSLPGSSGNLNVALKNKGIIKDGSSTGKETSAKELPAVKIKRQEISQAPAIYEAAENEKLSVVQNTGIEMSNVALKDILIFHLL